MKTAAMDISEPGERYSRPLKHLKIGAKLFAYMKGIGYVGYGEVTKEAVPMPSHVKSPKRLRGCLQIRTLSVSSETPRLLNICKASLFSDDDDTPNNSLNPHWLIRRRSKGSRLS